MDSLLAWVRKKLGVRRGYKAKSISKSEESIMKGLTFLRKVWIIPALALCILALWFVIPASAQTGQVPDMTQFGFTRVTGTVTFTPGQAVTLTAGTQTVQLPADFISKTVKFEFLEGDPAFFAANLGAQQ